MHPLPAPVLVLAPCASLRSRLVRPRPSPAPIQRLTYINGTPTPHAHPVTRRGTVAIPKIRSSSNNSRFWEKASFSQSVSHSVTDHRVNYVGWLVVGVLRQCSYQRWWLSEWMMDHSRRYCNTGYDQSQGRRPSTLKCIGSISQRRYRASTIQSEINPTNSDSRSRSDGRSRRFVQYRVDQSLGRRPRSLLNYVNYVNY